MRNAETILAIIRERGKQGLPLERVYRLLYNPDLYLRAYSRLYHKTGAMTPGSTSETVDGMTQRKIANLIDDVRQERHRWTPVRRVNIPKPNGKTRPLGLPSWSDKLLQEVMRSILEAYYEPQFSTRSHGFRPGRGCHTALQEIQSTWTGTRWFIEGDIAQCFDTIEHDVLLGILSEKLHDERFLRLIRNLLQSGYMEDWRYHKTYSGTPQGGVISPILANIYLDKLDEFVEKTLIPEYSRGKKRRLNPAYRAVKYQQNKAKRNGQPDRAKKLRKQMQKISSVDPVDPNYRRLCYIRYADDWLLGFAGPRNEAEQIKQRVGEFLQDMLKLKLAESKTLITHATTDAARFLGYDIVNQQADDKQTGSIRHVNGRIGLRVSQDVVDRYCAKYMSHGRPESRPVLVEDDDYTILTRYQQEYQGIVQYYRLAYNVSKLSKVHWVMRTSLLKTLAQKHRSTVQKMVYKYTATVTVEGSTYKCLQTVKTRKEKPSLVARFGGVPLKRARQAVLKDLIPPPVAGGRTEIIQRLLADECEICGSRKDVEVHHIRKLADLKRKDGREVPLWTRIMAERQRKTLVVCHDCHVAIHAGRPLPNKISE